MKCWFLTILKLKRIAGNFVREIYFFIKPIEYTIIRTQEDYKAFLNKNQNKLKIFNEYKERAQNSETNKIDVEGFCPVCMKKVEFTCAMSDRGTSKQFYLGETVKCPVCGLFNRTRTALLILSKLIGRNKNLRIHTFEQMTGYHKALLDMYEKENYITGSEYAGREFNSGDLVNGIQHEDTVNLSFENNSMDYLISNHVYEHVSDIDKTFEEAYRVLKKGGKLVFGIPFVADQSKTEVRAKIEDGNLIILKEPIYHGSPPKMVEGYLAFYDYGWDVFDKLKNAGFSDAYIVFISDEKIGCLSHGAIFTFVAHK